MTQLPDPMAGRPDPAPQSFFDDVGGHPTFRRLVDRFYQEVAVDPLLRPLYPEENLGPAAERLTLFLEQYWGGPRTYSDRRGHPRLRMRHAPFAIGVPERDAWLRAMRIAVADISETSLTAEQTERLWAYLVMAADSMVNVNPAASPGLDPAGNAPSAR